VADARNQLSPGGAIAIGLVFGAAGTFILLLGLGVITPHSSPDDAPGWVIACAGLAFVQAGLALIVGYGIARGVGPDGDLAPGTPLAVRATQWLLGLGITGCLAAIGTWVAFGPGTRHFSGGIGIGPIHIGGRQAGEMFGRAAFGLGAVVAWLIFALFAVLGFRRLRR
jgi:hypothetical protein